MLRRTNHPEDLRRDCGKAAFHFPQQSFGNRGTPAFSRMVIMGHQLVNPDWNRFSPTKPVNQSQFGLWKWASSSDRTIKLPAMILSSLSTYIVISPYAEQAGVKLAPAGKIQSAASIRSIFSLTLRARSFNAGLPMTPRAATGSMTITTVCPSSPV